MINAHPFVALLVKSSVTEYVLLLLISHPTTYQLMVQTITAQTHVATEKIVATMMTANLTIATALALKVLIGITLFKLAVFQVKPSHKF
jgi:predicted aspartyl protease